MGSFSNELEKKLLEHVFDDTYIAPDTYIGLSTADITDDASGNSEPGGGNYARKQVLVAGWNSAANRTTTNNGIITFNEASAAWGTITHWGIWNHLSDISSENLLAHGALTSSQIIANGNTASIADKSVTISFNVSGASDYLANTFLDYIFKDGAFATPNASIYIALLKNKPTDAGTGTTIADNDFEPSTLNNYYRILNTSWTHGGSLNHMENQNVINFNNPSGSWGEITHTCQVDATASGGNILFHGRVGIAQTPDQGSTVSFAASSYDITVT